ncbi:uncharacterized protein MONBRDRAFT_29385 [Monosiga brevicollis MX1]|uniref:Elongation of fatty acids protein n=1 Tax=Monosiga brevicollis TaxID=81824 RepID=A9VAX9_MONBE|nr:uncharacterized protein MONBRDRAFT_29385 [Monosiga brevicollis MX1]EDQ85242.1 predicted protein [Monosiga brevicollis MX1]|eukprot:XP_001749863.1 hypothetical protein [Monosiga brevicollis MX1]
MLDFQSLVLANVAYLVFIGAFTLYMKQREPFNPTTFMRLYNASCVILAGAVCYGMVEYCIRYQFISFVGNPDMIKRNTEAGRHLHFYCWLYYIQKFWEFLDTVIFIARKSWRQVTFLHIYHHCSITIVTRSFIVYGLSGDLAWPSFLNALVHVFMYSHYLCATFKIKTWWKPFLTQMQLVQFLAILAQALLGIFGGPGYSYPEWIKLMLAFYMCTMLYLFGSFYIKSYSAPAGRKDTKKAE